MDDFDQFAKESIKTLPVVNVTAPANDMWADIDTAAKIAPQVSTTYTERNIPAFQKFLHSGAAFSDVTVGGIIPGIAAPLTYAAGRTFMNPEGAKRAEEKVLQYTAQPFGNLFGVTESPYYKNEATNRLMTYIGENMSKGADWIARQTGVPKSDIENMMQSVAAGVGAKVAPVVGKAGAAGLQAVESTAGGIAKATKRATEALAQPSKYTPMQVQMLAQRLQYKPTVEDVTQGRVSVGAAAAPREATIRAAIAELPPEEAAAVSKLPIAEVDIDALRRRVEAASIGIRLSEGQASQNPRIISQEMNARAQKGAERTAEELNQQNKQLVNAVNNLRDEVAPEAFGANKLEHGQAVIDAYQDIDRKLNTEIDKKYADLRDAAGGEFPVDAPILLKNIKEKLHSELLTDNAPAAQINSLRRMAESNNMTFENYLAMRRNLSKVAASSADGNERMAARFMMEELDKLPLQPDAASLKPLADEARAAARARFEMLDKDPAMRAAVEGTVPADKFTDKFVVNGVNKNIQQMIANLGEDSSAHHSMRAAALEKLKESAGITNNNGNFSQAGFNKALRIMNNVGNVNAIFGGEAANKLRTIGNVAGYTQFQPKGSFVNTSNTATVLAGLKSQAGNIAKGALDVAGLKTAGIPLGTIAGEKLRQAQIAAQTRKTWEPGAGVRKELEGRVALKDIGKE